MALISITNAKSYCDRLAGAWNYLKPVMGQDADSPAVAGTIKNQFDSLLTLIVATLADFQQQQDLGANANTALGLATVEKAFVAFKNAVIQLDAHCLSRGSSVSASIVDFSTYLSYYNGGSGGALFANMVTPGFGELYFALTGTRLPPAGLMNKAINPVSDSTATNGMGTRAVGGSFSAGASVDNTKFSEVLPLVAVTTTFVGGTGAPVITVAGTDHTGVGTTTWSVTLDSNNPTSAISTTITPAVTAAARQTVALASAAGIVVGSWLTINSGLVDQETVIVEAVSGSNITAVFTKAHSAGAAVTGVRTYATTPSVAGRRIRSVSGITVGITGHSAGAVRVEGAQDRTGI